MRLASLFAAVFALAAGTAYAYPTGIATWRDLDVTANDTISSADWVHVYECYFGVGECIPEDDVNHSGMVTANDAVYVQQCFFIVYICPEWTLTEVASGYEQPTSFGFHDGVLYVAEKEGKFYSDGELVHTVDTYIDGESGLVVYADDDYVFLYYAANEGGRHGRLTEWDGETETTIYDFESLEGAAGDHIGGGMVAVAGNLYLGRGDDQIGSQAQSATTTEGKILRIEVADPAPDPLDTIYAKGLRNPFTVGVCGQNICVQDVGSSRFEEINVLAEDANYGWPTCEGSCVTIGMTNPIHQYARSPGAAIIGGVTYSGIPSNIDGDYLFGDFIQHRVKGLHGATSYDIFHFDVLNPVAMHHGPEGIYILSFQGSLYLMEPK